MPLDSSPRPEFGARAQHAEALDAPDVADRQGLVETGHVGAGGREHRLHPGARIRRSADDLDGLPVAGIHGADTQTVGIGVLFGREHMGDDKRRERRRLVLDAFDFETDPRQRLGDVLQRRVGVEVLLEPGEGEFHEFVSSAQRGRVLAIRRTASFLRSSVVRDSINVTVCSESSM